MNTLIYGMHWISQTNAMKQLEKDKIIDIKVWIGKNKDNTININKLRRGLISKENFSGINQDIYDKVYQKAFPVFLDMFARNPSQYAITHQEAVNIYNYYFDYCSKLLHDNKIELMIFHMLPHFGSDYLLSIIAEYMNIKMILTYQSLIPNRFHYVTSLDDFGAFQTVKITFDHPSINIDFNTKKVQFYMKNIDLKYKSCNYNLLNRIRQYLFRSLRSMTPLGIIKSYCNCLAFKSYYKSMALNKVDFNTKYIYFPLQMQPEMTTSTLGGIFTDQILALEKLSTIIPNDWLIYVKENPKQLEGHRGKYFFERLKLLPKARYISKEINSFDLIDNCQFVSTITGTAGWEAIISNKVCLIFGQAWYQNFNGIIKWHNNLTLEDILSVTINNNKVQQDYNNLVNKTANGIVDRGYISNYKEYSDESNAQHIYNSFKRIIQENF